MSGRRRWLAVRAVIYTVAPAGGKGARRSLACSTSRPASIRSARGASDARYVSAGYLDDSAPSSTPSAVAVRPSARPRTAGRCGFARASGRVGRRRCELEHQLRRSTRWHAGIPRGVRHYVGCSRRRIGLDGRGAATLALDGPGRCRDAGRRASAHLPLPARLTRRPSRRPRYSRSGKRHLDLGHRGGDADSPHHRPQSGSVSPPGSPTPAPSSTRPSATTRRASTGSR